MGDRRVSRSVVEILRRSAAQNDIIESLIFSRKPFVDPEEFLAFVHHADKTTEAGVFGGLTMWVDYIGNLRLHQIVVLLAYPCEITSVSWNAIQPYSFLIWINIVQETMQG